MPFVGILIRGLICWVYVFLVLESLASFTSIRTVTLQREVVNQSTSNFFMIWHRPKSINKFEQHRPLYLLRTLNLNHFRHHYQLLFASYGTTHLTRFNFFAEQGCLWEIAFIHETWIVLLILEHQFLFCAQILIRCDGQLIHRHFRLQNAAVIRMLDLLSLHNNGRQR